MALNLIMMILLIGYSTAFKCKCTKNDEEVTCSMQSKQGTMLSSSDTLDQLIHNAVPFSHLKQLHIHCDIKNVHLKALANQETLKDLDLSHNLMNKLPANFFQFTPELITLNLSWNKFKIPDLDTFSGLLKLRYLDLSHNLLTKLDMGILDGMVLLETLLLNNNNIRTFPAGMIDELVNLKEIDLSKNSLRSIDPHLFDSITKLEDVNFSENKLDKENALDGLAELVSLINLDISNCQIQKLSPSLFTKLTNLQQINLNFNPIILLPNMFDHAKSLTTLYMSECGLTSVPAHLFDHNPDLEELDISHNKISTLHESLLNKTLDFKYLNISHNLINDVPLKIFQWTSLTEIDLSFNRFTTIPPELLNMATLESVHAQHNEISFLDDQTFSTCTYPMIELDLSYNRLVYLQEHFFDWLANLEKIKIFGNPWDCECLQDLIKLLNNRFIQYDDEEYQRRTAICVAGDPYICPYYTTNLTYYYDIFKSIL